MKANQIIIIYDDKEDLKFITQAFIELQVENELIIFDDGMKFINL